MYNWIIELKHNLYTGILTNNHSSSGFMHPPKTHFRIVSTKNQLRSSWECLESLKAWYLCHRSFWCAGQRSGGPISRGEPRTGHNMGLFKVIFYFPNGKSTIWGIYSEYIYIIIFFLGEPLKQIQDKPSEGCSDSDSEMDLRHLALLKPWNLWPGWQVQVGTPTLEMGARYVFIWFYVILYDHALHIII